MSEFHFLRPLMLLCLLPLIPVWWTLWRGQDSYARLKRLVDPHLLEYLVVGETQARRVKPVHLLSVIWVLSALALAGPTWDRETAPFADNDAGLVVLLKTSGTMKATDVQPSRLDRAKHKLRDLLQSRKGASTGLIVYSGSAHLVMPLTRDDRIVSAMVEDLTPELMPVDGDALAEALELADRALRRAGVPGSVLVMADAVTAAQVEALKSRAPSLPVQFLAVNSPAVEVEPGLSSAASTLDAPVLRLSVDETDMQRAAQRAASNFKAVSGTTGGDRWRDAGYMLLPIIALVAATWSRRGWLTR